MTEQHTPTSVVLNRAADLIQERGWTQFEGWNAPSLYGEGAELCLEGGIMAALGMEARHGTLGVVTDELKSCPAYVAVQGFVNSGDYRSKPLWRWNDHPLRTDHEVVATLRAAAATEAAREAAADGVTYVAGRS